MLQKRSVFALLIGVTLAASSRAALIINEVDSDTVNVPTTDFAEFLELYDTSGTSVPLDGYVLVFYNGANASNAVYRAEDLDGKVTRPNGYFVAGAVAGADLVIPGNTIQNGGDAIALFLGNAADFTTGQALSAIPATATLIDAVVYQTGPDGDADDMVSTLLVSGGVVDEFGRDGLAATGALDSIGRLPNGSGSLRSTLTYSYMTPTPGAANTAPVPEPALFGLVAIGGLLFGACRRAR
jgi:hypothetical protein